MRFGMYACMASRLFLIGLSVTYGLLYVLEMIGMGAHFVYLIHVTWISFTLFNHSSGSNGKISHAIPSVPCRKSYIQNITLS